MINVELSNIWGCVSLPDLLGWERDIFDAHLKLRSNQPDEPGFLSWLGQSDAITARTVHAIHAAADSIAACADTLVVIGSTNACRAAEAGLALLAGQREARMRVLFAGRDLSADRHLKLCDALQNREYCLLLAFENRWQMENSIASRSVRWMMERKYGMQAKKRIYLCAPVDSSMAAAAEEEGHTFLPVPGENGAACSALTSAMLLPMAVCGIDPIGILEGAAAAYEEYDLRAFENPVWMYVGARCALSQLGKRTELLGCTEPVFGLFGKWWQQSTLSGAGSLQPVWCPLPEELPRMQALIDGRLEGFATLLHIPPVCAQKIGVEMDWKDRDGLGYLDGRSMQEVAKAFVQALGLAHEASGAPQIVLECDSISTQVFGELLYFFELANALCAQIAGPAASESQSVRELLPQVLGSPEL